MAPMAEPIIDLRKNLESAGGVGPRKSDVSREASSEAAIRWSAYEYAKVERGPYWFFLPGGAALVLIIFTALAKSYFFMAFTALAFALLIAYMKREPRMVDFALTKEGVTAGNHIYDYASLKSFWIFEDHEPQELSLETGRALNPYVKIPLGDLEAEKVRGHLQNFLKESEHQELFSDQIVRGLGI